MTSIFTEETKTGKLTFEFSDKWQVYEYDKKSFYTKIKAQGLKGVDFLASSNDKILLLMEVKYVTASDKNSYLRFDEQGDKSKPYVVDEIIKKVRDTLLGIVAGSRQNDNELTDYFNNLNQKIIVIFFLERNDKLNAKSRYEPMASNLRKAINQKLNFLGNIKVDVVNSLTIPKELGIQVSK